PPSWMARIASGSSTDYRLRRRVRNRIDIVVTSLRRRLASYAASLRSHRERNRSTERGRPDPGRLAGGVPMASSLGIGLPNACDLACAHCYRDTERVDQLTEAQVTSVCDHLPARSVNLGTGENGLHPDYAAIVQALGARGLKLSLTSNGYTIGCSSDETLRTFREVEISIDFPTEAEQDVFRGAGNWKRVMAAMERARRLGITVTVLSVMMKINYTRLAEIARIAFAAGANYRVNVYQPVKTDRFTLSYEEFWEGFGRLLEATRLVSTTEPVL